MNVDKKWRYPHWWFGRYIQWMGNRWVDESGRTFPKSQVNIMEMQEYEENIHGLLANPIAFTAPEVRP